MGRTLFIDMATLVAMTAITKIAISGRTPFNVRPRVHLG
jgi:hypothetical protein